MSEVSYHIRIPSVVGKYRILRQIGKGGFAVVVQAVDTKTNQFVAIKIVNRQEIQRQNNMMYLENELRLCSRFDHPSIVKVFDIIYEDDIIMIVMEYFQNGDLQSLISHGVRLSFEECIRASYQILDGLTYLHKRGISHRDIKPENILFDDEYNPKLVDFGLAKENSDALSTFCGTAWYIAPEIVKESEYDGRKADVWAFGVTMHLLVTGTLPFDLKCESQFVQDILHNKLELYIEPKGILGTMIENALKLDPKERMSSEDLFLYLQTVQIEKRGMSIAEFAARRNASKQTSLPRLAAKVPVPLKSTPKLLNDRLTNKMKILVRKRLF